MARCQEAIPVYHYSDKVTYGNRLVVIVDSWLREEYHIIDLDSPVTEQTRNSLPLSYYFQRYDWKVFHLVDCHYGM